MGQCERMTPRVYTCGIIRHIIRAAQNHLEITSLRRQRVGARAVFHPSLKRMNPPVVNGPGLWTRQAIRCVIGGSSGRENSVRYRLAPLEAVRAGKTIPPRGFGEPVRIGATT